MSSENHQSYYHDLGKSSSSHRKFPPSNRQRRRKPGTGFYNSKQPRADATLTTTDQLKDVANVQLEQAVRELNCFEGFFETHNHHKQNHYRTFALDYLEGILGRWCRAVEEGKARLENQQPPPANATIHSGPPSFAAVAAWGTSSSSSSSPKKKTFADAVAHKPNAWHRPPPSSVLGKSTAASSPTTTTTTSVTPPPTTFCSPIAALIPFGSYRLGVHSTTSDLDLLALAPPYIHRSDFFTSLVKLFQEDERCFQVHPIASAYTPVIKFVLQCGGIDEPKKMLQIDLVFARVTDATKLLEYHSLKAARRKQQQGNAVWSNHQAPLEYILDDSDLQDLDEAGVRSLNGARVSQMLLESVQQDVGKFQLVLCAVKQWAEVRGVYSNVLGFLGGVNWAIMVAWVCERYPDASAALTLQIFFHTFGTWRWNNPVMLKDAIADTPPITNVSRQTRAVKLPAWNPQTNPRDGLHVMPIITPAYPSMNSSYNVDYPQLRRIQNEMIRTSDMFQRHNSNNKTSNKGNNNNNVYRQLFTPSDFFERNKHFLQINIRASNKQDFVEWFRLVESKIRVLVSTLETTEVHACPFGRFFSKPKVVAAAHHNGGGGAAANNTLDDFENCFFIALRFAPKIDQVDIRHLTMDFLYKVNTWEGRKSTMDLSIAHITDEDLPMFVWEAMKDRRSRFYKEGAEHSVGSSENTAISTDDEDDDSFHSVEPDESPNNECLPDLASPTKKSRVASQAA